MTQGGDKIHLPDCHIISDSVDWADRGPPRETYLSSKQ
jgi:hypothetical protein